MGLRPITYSLDVVSIAGKLGEDNSFDEDGNRVLQKVPQEIIDAIIQKSKQRKSGFAAQEVEELANTLGFDFGGVDKPENEGNFYGLRYAEFVVPIVKAIQEQQSTILNQQLTIEELKKEVETLKRLVQ